MKFWCRHRWSNVKRWQVGNQYFVIQRCRRCERWIRKTLELIQGKLEIVTETYVETDVAFRKPELIQPLEKATESSGSSVGTSQHVADAENPQEKEKKSDESSVVGTNDLQ